MARQQIDLGLVGNDLHTAGGDFALVESTLEHQRQLIQNNKGDFKENPTICVGVERYIDDDNGFATLVAEISRQLAGDGMDVESVQLGADGTIRTKAQYND